MGMRTPLFLVALAGLLLLASCGPRTTYLSDANASVSSAGSYYFYDLDSADPEGGLEISLATGSGTQHIYLIFTNPTAGTVAVPDAALLNRSAVASAGPNERQPESRSARSFSPSNDSNVQQIVRDAPLPRDWIPVFRTGARGITVEEPLLNTAPQSPAEDVLGDTATFSGLFYDGETEYPSREFPSTLRKVVGDPSTATAPSVSIWVADGEWSPDGDGGPVTQEMVDALAEQFFNPADGDSEIADWLVELYGNPWSDLSGSEFTPFTNNVSILIHDIEDNNGGDGAGGIVGYFWSKDNYTNAALASGQPVSNERIMFYLDSETLAAATGIWEPDDYWPQVAFSTLAHELQHMIHFHQRTVLRGAFTPTWMNEMMSLLTEDLVADRLGVSGPRGVTGPDAGLSGNAQGRLPRYNYWNDISLAAWGGTGDLLDSYAISYAFGAYLARNYGGAQLAAALMDSSAGDPDELLASVTGVSLEGHLWRWGLATLRSQNGESVPFRLNPGSWMSSTVGALEYRLGSINHFNYQYPLGGGVTLTGPWIWSSLATVSEMKPVSKLIYYAGAVSDGRVDLSLSVPAGVDVTVVIE